MQLLVQHAHNTGSNTYELATAFDDPLKRAARGGHLEAVRWLLDHGGDPNTALAGCARSGHMDILRLLIDRGADILPDGPSLILCAILKVDVQVTQLLLEMGVPINTVVLQELQALQQAGVLSTCISHSSKQQSAALLEAAVRHGHTEFARLWGQAHATVHGGDGVPKQQAS
jgi:ankyrin repeat protein